MIEGLKLDVSADELARRLAGLIAWHESRASGCGDRLHRLGQMKNGVENIDGHLDDLGWDGGLDRLTQALARKLMHHRERASLLEFLRDHLVEGEVYRLDLQDLRFAGLLPGVQSTA